MNDIRSGRRWRVAILGNSVPLLVVPERRQRAEGSYGEVLEDLLAASGLDATVTNRSRLFELVHEGARRYGKHIAPLQPEVVIFHYGILELQPNVLPTTINRHLSRQIPGGRGFRRLWYGHAVPRLWPLARDWQRWAAQRAGARTWRLHPSRFVAELNQLVRVARSTKALVLVVDVHEPGPRLEHFMPGITERWQVFQEQLRRYVATTADADVRLVEVSSVVSSLGEGGTADGLHLTAEAHRLLAEALTKEIVEFSSRTGTEGPG